MAGWPDVVAAVNDTILDTFGEVVTYTPIAALATPFALTVAWSEDATVRQRQGIQASAMARLVDFPAAPAKGDGITRNSLVYVVVEQPVDGEDRTALAAETVTLYLRLA